MNRLATLEEINEDLEVIELFGHSVLFTNFRVNKDEIPSDYNIYEVRHDSFGDPAELSSTQVFVDYYGTVLSKDKLLEYGESKFIGEDDINFLGEYTTIE